MSAIVARHEIEIGRLRRKQCRTERMSAWAGDRARRESLHTIRIVRAHDGQVAFMNIAVKCREPIDDRRIALQGIFLRNRL